MSSVVQEIPTEVARYVMERDGAFPDAHFEISHHPVREVDRPAEERGYRAMREKYSRTFYAARPGPFSVGGVNFLYGQETWTVRIIAGLDEEGNIRTAQTVGRDEGLRPLPHKLRNEIAGFDPARFERMEVQAGERSALLYGEPRTDATPFRERPESFARIDPKRVF